MYCTQLVIIIHFSLLGLYYFPKEKGKLLKDLVCLATFDVNEIYTGINWKKKFKAPTDFCFAIKHPKLQQPKSVKYIKFLCADDRNTLDRWIVTMRIAKVCIDISFVLKLIFIFNLFIIILVWSPIARKLSYISRGVNPR